MRLTMLILNILIILNSQCPAYIEYVEVRDRNFEIIAIISNKKDIAKFQSLWEQKIKVKENVEADCAYKIDIIIKDRISGIRWCYDKKGYCRLLSKVKTDIYKITKPHIFNSLLKIDESERMN